MKTRRHHSTMGSRIATLTGLLLGALLAARAEARLPPCQGEYVLHQSVTGDPLASPQKIHTGDGVVSLEGLCPATEGRVRANRRGTAVRARWASCPGLGRVDVKGKIPPSCGTFTGVIKTGAPFIKIPVIATPTTGDSIRMVTYNVQMTISGKNADVSEERVDRIVARLLAGGYDVIVLNEVQDEDDEIRGKFVSGLKGEFPYFVSFLDSGDWATEDSGLMLFSRLPFATYPALYPIDRECEGSDCSQVNFAEYQNCEDPDCWAEKGVGHVRLRNPETQNPINVFFTHMQASYPGEGNADATENVVVRRLQLGVIKNMMDWLQTNAFPPIFDEDIYVMGDLNVDGDLDNPVTNGDYDAENIDEWNYLFNRAGSVWTDGFHDGWAYENAPKDPSGVYDRGITNRGHLGTGSKGARLDYIVRNNRGRTCMQHMTLSHNLRWSADPSDYREGGLGPNGIGLAGRKQLADHIGVNADVNLHAPHCSPSEARLVDTNPGSPAIESGDIRHPGSIQWFRFDGPGTYSFAVAGADDADFRVYQGDDLTTPVSQYKKMTVDITIGGTTGPPLSFVGKTFHIAKAPFYVRVWKPARTATGPYTLIALEHDCRKEYPCALGPGEQLIKAMNPNPPVNGEDELWFVTEAESGIQQDVAYEADWIGAPVFQLRLEDENGEVLDTATTLADDPEPGDRLLIEGSDPGGAKRFMVLRRVPSGSYQAPYPPEASAFRVQWRTNLVILYGSDHGGVSLDLWCHEENDGAIDDGDDEVYMNSAYKDTVPFGSPAFVGDFDSMTRKPLEDMLGTPVSFTDKVELAFFEDDGAAAGDDDWMHATINASLLPPDQLGPLSGEIVIHDQEGAGTYSVYYNLTHGFDE